MKEAVQRKNFRLNTAKLRRAQRELGTKTETDTIHKALDLVTNEARLAKALRNLVERGRGHFDFDDVK